MELLPILSKIMAEEVAAVLVRVWPLLDPAPVLRNPDDVRHCGLKQKWLFKSCSPVDLGNPGHLSRTCAGFCQRDVQRWASQEFRKPYDVSLAFQHNPSPSPQCHIGLECGGDVARVGLSIATMEVGRGATGLGGGWVQIGHVFRYVYIHIYIYIYLHTYNYKWK